MERVALLARAEDQGMSRVTAMLEFRKKFLKRRIGKPREQRDRPLQFRAYSERSHAVISWCGAVLLRHHGQAPYYGILALYCCKQARRFT